MAQEEWEGYLNERMKEALEKAQYTHKPLHNAYPSIIRNLLVHMV